MARFLLCTIPIAGHVSPGKALACALIQRGHEVWWYTGGAFKPLVESTGAKFVLIQSWSDYSDPDNVPKAVTDQRQALRGPAQLKFDLKHFFIDVAAGQVKDIAQILETFRADVVVTDSFFLGGGWLWEQGGPPWAEFGISTFGFSSRDTAPFGLGLQPQASLVGRWRNHSLHWLFEQVLWRDLTTHTNKVRASLGLPASRKTFFDTLSPFLYLAGTVPSFEYPRSDLPPQVHFVGPLLSSIFLPVVPPTWWSDLQGGQPVVLVTQGTIATALQDLLLPTLTALAQTDVLVVATTGGADPAALPVPLPPNARVEPYISFVDLLPHVDVMISNGGFNGVQMALAHGIPLVVAGSTEDKPEICARVEWSGVGINLKTKSPRPGQIKAAVNQLLTDPSYRSKAQQLQAEMSRYRAPELAATLLEQLALTQQPLLRS